MVKSKRPELIAPIQDWKTLKYVQDLPDAIYFGIQKYNMRKRARNFKKNQLKEIVNFCHEKCPPIKTYLATNILIYNDELKDLRILLTEAKEAGIDAIIAHDLATIKYSIDLGIDFHISTQCNVSNIEAASFYENLGAQRITLARELSLSQIKEIKNSLKETEIECFIHGSMCTAISGRCYLSATITGSEKYSANRGNCVQPCRRTWRVMDDENNELIYDGLMFLNAKDLCMIEHIPLLIEAKIDAFKIEGRMKDPLYVRTVVKCYREAIDSYFENDYTEEKIKNWIRELKRVYNRGFHTGFYFKRPSVEDIEFNKRGNVSPYRKNYIGKILNYNPVSKTANVLLENNSLSIKKGDTIIIEGENTYNVEIFNFAIIKGEKFEKIPINSRNKLKIINLRLEKCEPNDKIYLFSK